MAEFIVHHGGVSVPSLEDAIRWYGDVLGFEVEKRFRIAPAKANAAMIQKGPLRLELFEVEGASTSPLSCAKTLAAAVLSATQRAI